MASQHPQTEMSRRPVVTGARPLPIRVVVAESSPAIREYLADTLEGEEAIELIAACSDGLELEAALAAVLPDVLVTDVRVPPSQGDEGIRIARRLRERDPSIGVVLLSQYAEAAYVLSLLESGSARAYLLTEHLAERRELINAIERVAEGGIVVDPEIVESLIEARACVARSPLPRLGRGERKLLAMVVEGRGDAAIASSLGISGTLVGMRVRALFEKLDLHPSGDASRRSHDALAYLAEEGG